MRKLILLILIVFFAFSIKAQMWCPPGAEWHYSAYAVYPSTNGYYKIVYLNDTVVNGLTYKKLIKTFNGFNVIYGPSYVSYTDKVIYTRDQNNVVYLNTDTLYDFNATIGNKWLRPQVMQNFTLSTFCDAPRRYVTVLDTGHININSLYLKTLKLQYEYKTVQTATQFPIYTTTVTACEKIGDMFGSFEPTFCETYSTIVIYHNISDAPLRCYSDNNFALYTNPQYTGSCTYIATTKLNELKIKDEGLKIYPNPANDILNVEINPSTSSGSSSVAKLEIINSLGQVVYQSAITNIHSSINIKQLSNGFYQLKLSEGESQKLIKFIKSN